MRIRSARLVHFRNLEECECEFSPGVNLILGENGHGKTNLLEGLNYIALGRSHRGAFNEDVIRFSADDLSASVTVDIERGDEGYTTHCFDYAFQRGGGWRLRIDGERLRRRSDLVGRFSSVFFDPVSLEIVRGGPAGRRRFIDQGMSYLDAEYLRTLQSFRAALKQKSRLLADSKRAGKPAAVIGEELRAWNKEISIHAAAVMRGRQRYAEFITDYLSDTYKSISNETAFLSLLYRPNIRSDDSDGPEDDLEGEIFARLDYIVGDEIRRGRPLAGPQSDDFRVELDERDLRSFGSRGETRSAAISLILAQSEVVYRRRRLRPVLFFDDIFSELDRKRSRQLQERAAREHQVFIATARPEDVADWQPPGLKSWQMCEGVLRSLS